MKTATRTKPPQLPPLPPLAPELTSLLAGVARRLRRLLWQRGMSLVLVAIGVLFWTLVAVDWYWEPMREIRLLLLVVAAVAIGYVIVRFVAARVFAPLPKRSLALLIERHYPLDDTLLTAVELADRADQAGPYTHEMYAATCHRAIERSAGVDVERLFDARAARRATLLAALALGSVAAWMLASPQTARLAVARMLTLTDRPWPRQTRLSVVGFHDNEMVVARGNELKLTARADLSGAVPERVTLRYWAPDGSRDQKLMVRVGNATAGRDEFQPFEYRFQSVLEPLELEIRGGDARLRGLRLRVVENPSAQLTLRCEFPSYLGSEVRTLSSAAVVPIPIGSRVTLVGEANKDLRWARLVHSTGGAAPQAATSSVSASSVSPRKFEIPLGELSVDLHLQLTLHDTDEVENRDPLRLTLAALADQAPQVQARLSGIGPAITPIARLPVTGKLSDDHGVAGAAVVYQIDESAERRHPLVALRPARADVQLDEAFDVAPLGLKPGQKLVVGVQATDNFHLPDQPEPNVGRGERFLLDIVTPQQLRALLEAREMNLRLRYERIVAEMTETRDLLIDGKPAGESAEQPASAEQRLERSKQTLARVRQNAEKSAQEILGVATSFDDIGAELTNNRIDTEELLERLQSQIAQPLHRLVDDHFVRFQQRLQALDTVLGRPADEPAPRQAALALADAILVEMQKIRDKMLELEDFNQALEMLRTIIAAQQEIGQETKKRRSDKIRQLLED